MNITAEAVVECAKLNSGRRVEMTTQVDDFELTMSYTPETNGTVYDSD
jgi:hypothetical protein